MIKFPLSLHHIPEQTVSCALLVTEPCSFVAVHVKSPESSGKVSAITRVHISSGNKQKNKLHRKLFKVPFNVKVPLYVRRTPESASYTKKCWGNYRGDSSTNGFNENHFVSKINTFSKLSFQKGPVLNCNFAVTTLHSLLTHSIPSVLCRTVLIHTNQCVGFHTQLILVSSFWNSK